MLFTRPEQNSDMQHTTINLPSAHPVRALTGLARAIALPAEHEPQRFPSFPALERTAIMGFNQPSSLTVPASSTVKILLARQAGFPVWADQVVVGGAYSYYYNSEAFAGAATTAVVGLESAPCNYQLGNPAAGTSAFGVSSGGNPPVNYPIFGIDLETGPMPYFYVPPGYNTYCVVANGYNGNCGPITQNLTFTVNCDVWTAPGENKLAAFPGTALAANVGGSSAAQLLSGTGGFWVRPRDIQMTVAAAVSFTRVTVGFLVVNGTAVYTPSTTTFGSFAVTTASLRALLPLTVSSEFANSKLPWYSARTTAASLLMTNVTQVLNKAGTVLCGRTSPNVISPFEVQSTYIAGLHPAEKAWLPLETGMYTFCPPSSDLANFWDYTLPTSVINTTTAGAPVYRLDNDSMVNVAFATAGAVDETFAVTSTWHLEFRTSSALFPIALSGMTLETLHQAQLALAAAGFFFDNPDHKAILNAVLSGVNKVAPAAMAAIRTYNPAVAAAISGAHKAVAGALKGKKVRVPEAKMSMPTTTAKASGMQGGKKAPPKNPTKPKGKKK